MHIVFLFYEGMTALDAIGPYEVLSRLPEARVSCVAKKAGIIYTCAGLGLVADKPLSEVKQADVLCIPGGGKATSLYHENETLAWIRAIHATTTWTTAICTGSLILGAAGLLAEQPATTHWAVLNRLEHWGAVPTKARVVCSGKIITAAGVSAGIDMALTLASKIAGQTTAEAIELGLEYDPEPPFDKGSPQKADPKVLQALQTKLDARFEKPEETYLLDVR